MNRLKRKIIKYFILCVFGSSIVESAWDSTWFDIIDPRFIKTESMVAFGTVIYIVVNFMIYACFAFLFWRLTNKAINAESKRQVSERNMQYSRICHDLKTPMTSIQGFTAALRDGKIKPEEQEEILNIIYNKSCYMNELVESLFDYSKLDTDAFELTLKKTDLGALVRNLVALHFDEFEKREMELEVDIPDEPLVCMLDEKEMKRSISNLIINAYKHNPNETKVKVQVYQKGESAYVVVADNGNPISPELEKGIFEPFVCGDEARTSGKGNGLGLVIARIVFRKHGGELCVKKDILGCTKGFVGMVKGVA